MEQSYLVDRSWCAYRNPSTVKITLLLLANIKDAYSSPSCIVIHRESIIATYRT